MHLHKKKPDGKQLFRRAYEKERPSTTGLRPGQTSTSCDFPLRVSSDAKSNTTK